MLHLTLPTQPDPTGMAQMLQAALQLNFTLIWQAGMGPAGWGFILWAKQKRGCSLLPVCRVTFIPGPARRGGMRSSLSLLSVCLGFAFLKPAPSPAAGYLVSPLTFKDITVG